MIKKIHRLVLLLTGMDVIMHIVYSFLVGIEFLPVPTTLSEYRELIGFLFVFSVSYWLFTGLVRSEQEKIRKKEKDNE